MNWITSILKILSELAKPFSSWWSKKQAKSQIEENIKWIKNRDKWRRKRDKLRKAWENATDTENRERAFKEYFAHINDDSPW